MKGTEHTKGAMTYRRVLIRGKQRRVNRLVCSAFHGPAPFEGAVARHLDGDSLNNRASNLAWGTTAENHADRERHGTVLRGSLAGRAKLTPEQVTEVRERLGAGESGASLARRFGLSESSISQIKRGKTYAATQP